MNTTLQLRILIWVAALLIAIISWVFIPLSSMQPKVMDSYLRSIHDKALSEETKHSARGPWTLTGLSAHETNSLSIPIVVSLDDDIDGVFQESPHSPVDIAVVLKNLERLGIQKLCSTTVFAWSDPDTISLAALDNAIETFDSSILSTPVSRGPTSEPLPASFRNSSIPVRDVKGNSSLIPLVNRLPIPGVILHPESLAGFTLIDSEPSSNKPYLLAQWDEQIIFSTAVLATMQHLGLQKKDLIVEMNNAISFGQSDIQFPIDEFGRLNSTHDYFAPNAFPAAATIDAKSNTFPENSTSAFLSDLRSNTSPTTLTFNQLAPAMVLDVLSKHHPSTESLLTSLHPLIELALLLVFSCGIFVMSGLQRRGKVISLSTATLALLGLHLFFTQHFQIWLPSMAAIASTIPCWLALLSRTPAPVYRGRPDRLDFVRYTGKSKAD